MGFCDIALTEVIEKKLSYEAGPVAGAVHPGVVAVAVFAPSKIAA